MDFLLDLFLPKVAYANLDTVLGNINRLIVNPLITFLFALAVVYFLYGVLEFVINSENEEKKTDGKSHMFWGVVGITIMLGVFGILNIILDTMGVKNQIDVEQGKVNLPAYNPERNFVSPR